MASPMILVSKAKWDNLQKDAKEKSESGFNTLDKSSPADYTEHKEGDATMRPDSMENPGTVHKGLNADMEYETLLARLSRDLRGKSVADLVTGKGLKVKRNTRKRVKKRTPPPGIPEHSTPPAKETQFRDLDKKPPLIEKWE